MNEYTEIKDKILTVCTIGTTVSLCCADFSHNLGYLVGPRQLSPYGMLGSLGYIVLWIVALFQVKGRAYLYYIVVWGIFTVVSAIGYLTAEYTRAITDPTIVFRFFCITPLYGFWTIVSEKTIWWMGFVFGVILFFGGIIRIKMSKREK